jgi:Cu(I)/Ag(I) efflux system membrane protein CusA/SilA
MINAIIKASLENRAVVLLLAAMLTAVGVYSYLHTPVDALPDLSDVQVIVRMPYPGQAPRLVEDQVTYPLTTALLSVPVPRPCAVIRSTATRSSTCCSRTAPIRTGHARVCSST